MTTLMAVTAVVVSVSWLTLAAGSLIPLLTGILTKQAASSAVKSVCTAVLASVGGILTAAVANDGKIYLEASVIAIAAAFMAAITLYYGFYKPTGISGTVQEKTANVGVG